jgi:predicted nucleotide-binding protein
MESSIKEMYLSTLENLIAEGNSFTYQNFSVKNNNYPVSFNPDWLSWIVQVKTTIETIFPDNNNILDNVYNGDAVEVIGNGEDKFKLALSYYIGGLVSTKRILEKDLLRITSKRDDKIQLFNKNDIFIVHGRNEVIKQETELFIKEIGLNPIVLHRQPDEGKTIIEKFEKNSDVGYAIILLTADETARINGEQKEEKRSRPNVIFEFGYFIAKLGRDRVCCIHYGDVDLPSDINGVVYKKVSSSLNEVKYDIVKELKHLGYNV